MHSEAQLIISDLDRLGRMKDRIVLSSRPHGLSSGPLGDDYWYKFQCQSGQAVLTLMLARMAVDFLIENIRLSVDGYELVMTGVETTLFYPDAPASAVVQFMVLVNKVGRRKSHRGDQTEMVLSCLAEVVDGGDAKVHTASNVSYIIRRAESAD